MNKGGGNIWAIFTFTASNSKVMTLGWNNMIRYLEPVSSRPHLLKNICLQIFNVLWLHVETNVKSDIYFTNYSGCNQINL